MRDLVREIAFACGGSTHARAGSTSAGATQAPTRSSTRASTAGVEATTQGVDVGDHARSVWEGFGVDERQARRVVLAHSSRGVDAAAVFPALVNTDRAVAKVACRARPEAKAHDRQSDSVQTRARRVPHGVCRSGFGSRARSLVRPSARRRPACRQAALPPCERKTCARVVRQPGDGR